MSDIKVGDLVQVIRPADCGCSSAVGLTRTVIAFAEVKGRCPTCGYMAGRRVKAVLDGPAPWAHWHIEPLRLKRVPPLEELERDQIVKELTTHE